MAVVLFATACAPAFAFAPPAHSLPALRPLQPFAAARVAASPAAIVDEAASLASTFDLAFADQAGKLAGTFFQASLLPYIGFLYFLSYGPNKTPKQAIFGHQFLLLFVLSTVFTGIVTKSVYGASLADTDWLHGGAEALLTTSNLYVASGYRNALAGEPDPEGSSFRYPGFLIFALVAAATAAGPSLGFEQHSAFAFGLGNLAENPLADVFDFVRAEPANALSIPTWAIHFSSVFEWLFAMKFVSQYAEATGNNRWRWFTYGMLPLHASGVAACSYHFFYNSQDVGFLVTMQAGLTLLGNTTVCIAALLLALSNGWTLSELNPFAKKDDDEEASAAPEAAAAAVITTQEVPSAPLLAGELVLLTAAASYLIKYGEPALSLPFEPSAVVAWALILGVPAFVGYRFVSTAPEQPAANA